MNWYELLLMQLSNDACVDENFLLEIPELIVAIKAKVPYKELLAIVNEYC